MQDQFGEGSNGEQISVHVATQSSSLMYQVEKIRQLASQNAVLVFSTSSCCMCYVVKRLFCTLGVNPTVYELDEQPGRGNEIEKALLWLLGGGPAVPAVFVGGKLVGGLDRLIASHINSSLVPLLKEAGAS